MSGEKVVRYVATFRGLEADSAENEEAYKGHRRFYDADDVAGLVESLEALIVEWESKVRDRDNDYNAGWDHAGQSHADQVRDELARFQP